MLEREWRARVRRSSPGKRARRRPSRYDLIAPALGLPAAARRRSRPLQNMPVVSWLLLRGRCASCRHPISARYPLVELLTGLLSAAGRLEVRLRLADGARRWCSPGTWSR